MASDAIGIEIAVISEDGATKKFLLDRDNSNKNVGGAILKTSRDAL